MVQYSAAGRPLHGASRMWAHVGHSSWQWTQDVELLRSPGQDGGDAWTGLYAVPASQLGNAAHLELQMVFKGLMPGGLMQWDNNGGANWQVRPVAAGLLLRMQGSCSRACSHEAMACSHDAIAACSSASGVSAAA